MKGQSAMLIHAKTVEWDKASLSLEKIADLVLDWRLYPRKQVDQQVVQNYARAMQSGANFPNVKVGLLHGKKIIVDGFHRINAMQQLKTEYAQCNALRFSSEAELFAEAVRLNSAHGKGFSEEDVKENIRRLKKYKFDVDEIVSLVHVPAGEIYREAAAPIVELKAPCGKTYRCDTNGKLKPGLSGKELVELKRSLVFCCNMAESGKIPSDDSVIRELVVRCRASLGCVRFHD